MLMLWLLMFSFVPLAFITGYSLVKFEEAINQEVVQRLVGNKREISVIFQEFYNELQSKNTQHSLDKDFIYYLSSNNIAKARDVVNRWIKSGIVHRISVFNREGRLEISLFRDANNNIYRQSNLESGDVFLSERFVQETKQKNQLAIVDFRADGTLDLIMFHKILAANGSLLGYIEEVLPVDAGFIGNLKNRLNLELAFISKMGDKVVSSHDDFRRYRQGFFIEKFGETKGALFELNIQDVPFGVMIQPLTWGADQFFVSVAASKQAAKNVLLKVNIAFFTVVGAVVILLIILSFIFSKIMLHPLNSLLDLVQNIDFENPPQSIPNTSDNELGILTESFNEMVGRVHTAQKSLKENIKKLEVANLEIRETQARLVHTAKMASLGQLVAGIAHELNNPISFIYSNMSHLRDYSNKLMSLVRTAAENPQKLEQEKEKLEYEYITTDMPKLIKSCEDGAKRTRDIVIGLRSFSRLEEAKIKEVSLHESIDSTLALLSGELKSKIKITKNYDNRIPPIMCYPSELNQVFMNILSNAIHAITDTGEIVITTQKVQDDQVTISIRDTGVGMSNDVKEKIFDPFFTTKDTNSGTGLGMSITYGIVKKHKGDIQVHSQANSGSEFIITLPIHL